MVKSYDSFSLTKDSSIDEEPTCFIVIKCSNLFLSTFSLACLTLDSSASLANIFQLFFLAANNAYMQEAPVPKNHFRKNYKWLIKSFIKQ